MNSTLADKLIRLSKVTGKGVIYTEYNEIHEGKIDVTHHVNIQSKYELPLRNTNLQSLEEEIEELILKLKSNE